MDTNSIPATLEPAFTPSFLAYLAQLGRQRHVSVPGGIAWSIFVARAMAQRLPRPTYLSETQPMLQLIRVWRPGRYADHLLARPVGIGLRRS